MLPKYLIAIIIAVLLLLTSPQSSFAAGKGTITIEPAVIDVTLENASSEASLSFSLTNNSDKPVTLEIFPIDFKQQDEFGRIAMVSQDEAGSYSYSLSSFLEFETNLLDLEPGEKRTVTATAQNRADLSPGGHYAAVVARLVQSGKETTVSPAVSSLVLLRKTGGERFNLSLKDVQWPKSAFTFTYQRNIRLLFQNEGNIHLVPHGRAEIKDMFGRLLYKGIINSPSSKVFPESRRYVPVEMKKIESSWPISFNTFIVRGSDSLQKTPFLYSTSFVYIHPLVVVFMVAFPAFILIMRHRKRKRSK